MEMATKGVVLNERIVSEVWQRQILTRPLRTMAGQEIEVIYGGRRSCSHGPDFHQAIIVFDGELRRGDVEVHVHAADWYGHRHHLDPAYDNVILHVVMWQTNDATPCKFNGEVAPVLCVTPHLAADVDELPSLLAAHPYVPFRCAEKCDEDQVLATLDMAGEQRLLNKAASIEGTLPVLEPEEALYRAIMIALGYVRNTAAFAEVAEIVPFSLLRAIALGEKDVDRPLALQAILLGKAGLLPFQRVRRSADADTESSCLLSDGDQLYEKRLAGKWDELRICDDGLRCTNPWRFGGVRPDNYPTRRLVGAAELFASLANEGLCKSLLGLLRNPDPRAARRALEMTLMVRASYPYWQRHCDFGRQHAMARSAGDGAANAENCAFLIGKARAAEIIVNAILPFAIAYGQATSDDRLLHAAIATYRGYPFSAGNEITRYMTALLLGAQRASDLRTAQRQQGLLHIYKSWCVDKRCADCLLGQLRVA
ncbi:MAG: DUF2851 family protein [Chloroflexi bacterium]|nr:DUF2851 family protein [Chloroflexota bacterium]